MNTNEVIESLLGLITGVGTFVVACEILSDNLQAISSEKLKQLFSKVSKNKLVGVCIGMVTTMLIQSSGATTVMLMGFVNAGIICLNQAATILLGSEIGTTLTGQIVALGLLGSEGISLTVIFAAFIGAGAFVQLIAKSDKFKKIGGIMIGFGMIFVGLSMMSSSMNSFAELDSVKTFLAGINSTIILMIVGAILTALIHSSSAMTTISITMIAAGLISLEQGIYITLGANVGTCITGALAAMTSGTNAKRTSLFQLLFNGGGVLLLAIIDTAIKICTKNTNSISIMFGRIFNQNPSSQLAMFHTVFNVVTVLMAIPISDRMAGLCQKLIKDTDETPEELRLYYFDENMMSTPSIATQQIKNEIIHMADIAIENFNRSLEIIKTLDFSELKTFVNNEKELNYLNKTLVEIISRLSKKTSNVNDYVYLSSTYRAISDFERIGDYSENIVEYAEQLVQYQQKFSNTAIEEITELGGIINELYETTIELYKKFDDELMSKAYKLEEKVDFFTERMANNHIKRMNDGECNAEVGAEYLQLSSDVERIADHLININDTDFIFSH